MVEQFNTSLLTHGSVDNRSAAATCVGVICCVGGVSRRQWLELQAVQHVHGYLLTDRSVDGGSAATMCVGVGGCVGGVSRRQMPTVDRLPPPVSVPVDVWVVSVE